MPKPFGALLSFRARGLVGGHRRGWTPPLPDAVVSHLDLTDRDQEDHPKYGPLAVANAWAALQTFSGNARAPAIAIRDGLLVPDRLLHVRIAAGGKGVAPIIADCNGGSSPAGSDVTGILGRGLSTEAGVNHVLGLDFLAGAWGFPANSVKACVTRLIIFGAAAIAPTASFYETGGYTYIFGLVTDSFGYRATTVTKGTNQWPFSDEHEPAALRQNRFRSNTQFFSLTPAFGGGLGVMGIANAVTIPTTNPAGGGALYASAGALYWRGSGGTVTLIAAA